MAFLADAGWTGCAQAGRRDLRQEYLEERQIGLWPELTGKADRRIRAGPDAVKHERLPLGRLRQRSINPDDADPAGGATGAAAANAGMPGGVAQAPRPHALA